MDRRKINLKIGTVVLLCFLFLILLSRGGFAGKVNSSDYETAKLCLNKSEGILIEMKSSNFSVERINDSLYELKNLFEAQEILKKQKRNPDFSLVFPYCAEIVKIRKLAFEATDDFAGLIKFYNVSMGKGMNTTSVDLIFSEIRGEIASERYEKVGPLIEKGYEEIANVRASNTELKLFYKTTTRNFKDFFIDNWLGFLIGFGVFFSLFLFYRGAVRKWIIRGRIRKLREKRDIFNKLIGQVQKDYFEKGKLSEREYTIKTKQFSEMVRDIDRQIPLLKTDYIKIERSGKTEGETAKEIRGEEKKIQKEHEGKIKKRVKTTKKRR